MGYTNMDNQERLAFLKGAQNCNVRLDLTDDLITAWLVQMAQL